MDIFRANLNGHLVTDRPEQKVRTQDGKEAQKRPRERNALRAWQTYQFFEPGRLPAVVRIWHSALAFVEKGQSWYSLGESNPCFRRERATS